MEMFKACASGMVLGIALFGARYCREIAHVIHHLI